MYKKIWEFKNNFEVFSVLYEDESFVLVFNDESKLFSFGMTQDFGTLCGFPVNWSSLNLNELLDILNRFIENDKKYIPQLGDIAKNQIKRWECMINSAIKYYDSGYIEV